MYKNKREKISRPRSVLNMSEAASLVEVYTLYRVNMPVVSKENIIMRGSEAAKA